MAAQRGGSSTSGSRRAPWITLGVLLAVILLVVLAVRALPEINLPGNRTVDRTQPAVLKSIAPLRQFRAATANLQVIVDVERDNPLLPSFLKGERVLFVAGGNVDAGVDFSQVGAESIEVDETRTRVRIELPAARLYDARVDPARSHVFDRDRGLIDRVESVFEDSPTEERSLYLLAERKLRHTAAADHELLRTAERNTRAMLEGLLRGLSFRDVTIEFAAPES
ncbi:MAG: DUF4230 domain-containing protein [Actinomycetota bacterium]|nr:DUF4230 domain-containing protein [Actinomycetota bacterium]